MRRNFIYYPTQFSKHSTMTIPIACSWYSKMIQDKLLKFHKKSTAGYTMHRFILHFALASLLILAASCTKEEPVQPPPPPPPPPPPTEPDTTTRAFSWDIQLFGDGQSQFNDVYAFNDTLAFAVGDIEKRGPGGQFNDIYNVAKWDGKKWELMKILIRDEPTDSSGRPYSLRIVYGDTPIGVIFSDGSRILYYDMKTVIHDFWFLNQWLGCYAIWGPQHERYFVGIDGAIVLGSGRTYAQEASPTTNHLTDVWGNSQEVWAVGGWVGWSESVRLRKHEGIWKNMDTFIKPYQSHTFSVWCDEKGYEGKGFVGFAGNGVFYHDYQDSTWKTLPLGILEGRIIGTGIYNSIRGSARNNVFASGHFGTTVHFNGRSWKFIPELCVYPNNRLITSVAVTKNRVFLVGFEYEKGIIITGTRKQ